VAALGFGHLVEVVQEHFRGHAVRFERNDLLFECFGVDGFAECAEHGFDLVDARGIDPRIDPAYGYGRVECVALDAQHRHGEHIAVEQTDDFPVGKQSGGEHYTGDVGARRRMVGQCGGHQDFAAVARNDDQRVVEYCFEEVRGLHGTYLRIFHHVAQIVVSQQYTCPQGAADFVHRGAVQAMVGRDSGGEHVVVFESQGDVVAQFFQIARGFVGNGGQDFDVSLAELFVNQADVRNQFFVREVILGFDQNGGQAQVARDFEVDLELQDGAFGEKVAAIYQDVVVALLQGLVLGDDAADHHVLFPLVGQAFDLRTGEYESVLVLLVQVEVREHGFDVFVPGAVYRIRDHGTEITHFAGHSHQDVHQPERNGGLAAAGVGCGHKYSFVHVL